MNEIPLFGKRPEALVGVGGKRKREDPYYK